MLQSLPDFLKNDGIGFDEILTAFASCQEFESKVSRKLKLDASISELADKQKEVDMRLFQLVTSLQSRVNEIDSVLKSARTHMENDYRIQSVYDLLLTAEKTSRSACSSNDDITALSKYFNPPYPQEQDIRNGFLFGCDSVSEGKTAEKTETLSEQNEENQASKSRTLASSSKELDESAELLEMDLN